MWSAFITGAATKATSLIDERDKEIQDEITLRINEMYKSAQDTKKKAETRRDKLTDYASQLKSLGFNDDETITILSSGMSNAENIVSLATEKAKISPITQSERTGLLPGGAKSMPGGIEEFIRTRTTPTAPEGATLFPAEQMRGAFGLPTRAAESTTKSLMARSGMTEQELLGSLPEEELSSVQLDLSVFSTENTKTLAQRLDRERIALFEAEQTGDEEEIKARQKNIAGLIKAKKEGADAEEVKPPSRADFRADIRNARAGAIQDLVVSIGSADFVPNPQTGELEYIGADPKARERIKQAVEANVRAYTQAFMDEKGTVPSDLADTLRGFGFNVPKNNRPFGGQAPTPTPPAAPEAGAPRPAAAAPAPVAPGPRPANAPPNARPLPRTAGGGIDRSKLEVGIPYYSSRGNVQIYTGVRGREWQPYQPAK